MTRDVWPGGVYDPVGPSSFPEGVSMTTEHNPHPRPRWWEYLIYYAVTYWWVPLLGAAGGLLAWWWSALSGRG